MQETIILALGKNQILGIPLQLKRAIFGIATKSNDEYSAALKVL